MQGVVLSINERRVKRLERVHCEDRIAAANAANVEAAHECMLFAHLHPDVWPVLNAVTLGELRSAVNWVTVLETIQRLLPPPQTPVAVPVR